MNRKFYVLLSILCGLTLVISLSLLIQPSPVLANTPPPELQIINDGLGYLQSQQAADGGILGFSGSSDSDTTSRSVLAFFLSGQPVTGVISTDGNTMLDYLATQAISFTHDTTGTLFPGRAGLLLSAVALAGENTADFGNMNLVTELVASFQTDSGAYSTTAQQGFSSGQASDLNQAWAVLGLSLAGESVPAEANQYLILSQAEDGSWGFGDPDTTALVVTSLLASQQIYSQDQTIQNALNFFHATQLPSGGWKPSWDTDPINADSTGWIIQAIVSAGEDPAGVSWTIDQANPVQALMSLQKPDGSIGGTYANPYSTADAIIGLTGVSLSGINSSLTNHQAGLAVFPGDGNVYTACVSFTEDTITGFDLLQRSGLKIEIATNPSQGTAVCSIEGVGCPSNDCFCNMPDYWSFWQYIDVGWAYSAVGSDQSPVIDGDVNAWSWGAGDPPAMISYQNICEGVPFVLPTTTPTSVPATVTPPPTQAAQVTQATTTSQPAEPENSTSSYLVYGAIILVLAFFVYYLIRSRRK